VRLLAPQAADISADSDTETACRDAACVKKLAVDLQARFVVMSRVQSTPEAYTVTVQVADGKTGELLVTHEMTCAMTDPCPPMAITVRQVAERAGEIAGPRMAEIQAREQAPPAPPEPEPAAFAAPRVIAVEDVQPPDPDSDRLVPLS